MTRKGVMEPEGVKAPNTMDDSELLRLLAQGRSVTEIARDREVPRMELAKRLRALAARLETGTAAGSTGAVRAGGSEAAPGRSLSLVAYTDGASRGNPGPAAIGVVLLKDGCVIAERAQPIGKTTNNVAEYRAVLVALEMAATYGARELEVRMDSELVMKQLTGQYRVRDPRLEELVREVRALAGGLAEVRWVYVPRTENARADALANQALDRGPVD